MRGEMMGVEGAGHEEGGRAKEGEVGVQSPFTVQLHIRSTSP